MNFKHTPYIALLVLTTVLQVFFKFYYDPNLRAIGPISFHLSWMILLHLSIFRIFLTPSNQYVYKIILLAQLSITLLLSFYVPGLRLTLMMSLSWLVLVKMQLLLTQDKFLRVFDLILLLSISVAAIGTITGQVSLTIQQVQLEILSNVATFALAFFLFRRSLLHLRTELQESEKKDWNNGWYFTMMKHFSHNLRTPMAAVQSNTELLRFILKEHDQASNILERLADGNDRLLGMINSLISASSVKNIDAHGESIANVVNAWKEGIQHPVVITNSMTIPIKIAGPEIISLLMALDAFVDNSFRYGASEFHVDIQNTMMKISDNGPGLTEQLYENIGSAHLNADAEGAGLGIYFSFVLLKDSGWDISITEWQNGLHYQVQRKDLYWIKETVGAKR